MRHRHSGEPDPPPGGHGGHLGGSTGDACLRPTGAEHRAGVVRVRRPLAGPRRGPGILHDEGAERQGNAARAVGGDRPAGPAVRRHEPGGLPPAGRPPRERARGTPGGAPGRFRRTVLRKPGEPGGLRALAGDLGARRTRDARGCPGRRPPAPRRVAGEESARKAPEHPDGPRSTGHTGAGPAAGPPYKWVWTQ